MGLLSIVMTPAQAAGILVIPALVTNIWQVASGPMLLALLRRFALMIVATVIGTFSTVGFLTTSSGSTATGARSEEHTSELQSRRDLVCRLLLEKKKEVLMHRIYNA